MKIVIESPVQHDGKLLDVGSEVDLPKDASEALVACGAAKAQVSKVSKSKVQELE